MRAILLSLTLISSVSNAKILTDDQASNIQQYLDDICGDTFCEGDFNWSFGKPRCEGNQCSILLGAYDFIENDALLNEQYRDSYKKALSQIDDLYIDYEEQNAIATEFSKLCIFDASSIEEANMQEKEDFIYEQVSQCIESMEQSAHQNRDLSAIYTMIHACDDVEINDLVATPGSYIHSPQNTYDSSDARDLLREYVRGKGVQVRTWTTPYDDFLSIDINSSRACLYSTLEVKSQYHSVAYQSVDNKKLFVRFDDKNSYIKDRSFSITITKE